MALRSFRARLLVGSILWTLGLLLVAHAVSIFLIRQGAKVRVLHIPPTAIVIAVVAMGAGIVAVQRGMSPIRSLRARLAAVRDGREKRIDGKYPNEVQPLVEDLNALLEHREELVRRAVAKAGDLAHGLKTPLAILEQEAEALEKAGDSERARAIRAPLDRMRRQVEYQLAHARAAASGAAPGATCSVAICVEGLVRALRRLHADRGVSIASPIPPDHGFRGETEDLHEMLGNLLDNACKWSNGKVTIRSERTADRLVILVDDDGPGLDPSLRDRVLQRGVRADEAAPGTGLGLAIVRELADLYGGSISLESSPLGGLRARLDLPGSTV
jgi:signal transduction histidine kinase